MSLHVNFVGWLGGDPETRQVGHDAACSFRVAIRGKRDDDATWVKVTAWGKLGETCQRYLSKGGEAYVVGTLTTSTYQGRDGQQVTSLDVRANSVEFVGKPRSGAAGSDHGERAKPREQGGGWGGGGGGGTWGAAGGQAAGSDDDDPIPF